MKKVAIEVATAEFENWLELKKIGEKKRTENAAFGDVIIENITTGTLKFDANSNLIFTLPEPLKDDEGAVFLAELVFKPRIRVHELNAKLKGIKADDVDGRIAAYIAAITSQNIGVVGKLYTEDYSICQAIAMYFL